MSELFSGFGKDLYFLAVKSDPRFLDIHAECECLWKIFQPLSDLNFIDQFSRHFRDRFWEMYVGALLVKEHGEVKSGKSGPDFFVPSGGIGVHVEATVANRGTGLDAIPSILDRHEDDDSVPTNECVLRVTSSLYAKARANNAIRASRSNPYVIAINLPYPEPWLCKFPPLAAQATLGVGGLSISLPENGEPEMRMENKRAIKKLTGSEVTTTAFESPEFDHVSALMVASVNPFSSTYIDPSIEFLHNPRAINPLPPGWLPVGYEYRKVGGHLELTRHSE